MLASETVTALTLELFALARTVPPSDFVTRATGLLAHHLPFHTGVFGVAQHIGSGLQPVSMHLLNLPSEFKDRYMQRMDGDLFLKALVQQPGKTVDMDELAPLEQWPDDFGSQVPHRYGIGRALGTCLGDAQGPFQILVVHRPIQGASFSAEERRFKAAVTPALFEAHAHNQLLWLNGSAPAISAENPRVAVLCDEQGLIVNSSGPFIDALQRSYRNWSGPDLPFRPSRCHSQLGRTGADRSLRFRTVPLDAQLWLVEALYIGALQLLTERQLQIAELAVQGHTDKELARLLELSPSTINNHLNAMFARLKISSRLQLAELWNRSPLARKPGYARAGSTDS